MGYVLIHMLSPHELDPRWPGIQVSNKGHCSEQWQNHMMETTWVSE